MKLVRTLSSREREIDTLPVDNDRPTEREILSMYGFVRM